MDAGPTGSLFPLIAASLGIKVTGIDILPWDIQFKNYTHLLADLKKIPIESNYFDLVSSISTMEHLGLPRFGETPDKDADIKGMKELIRVLKPKGHIILTVPFGKPIIFQNKHRVYDKKALKKLIGNLKIVKQEFFAPVDNILTFRPCTQEEVFLVDTKTGTYGVNCIVAQKI